MRLDLTTIPLFPPEIDRRDFGNWLSGFCDGEACFVLQADIRPSGSGCRASIRIELRDDDTEILSLIQSYWQCGYLYTRRKRVDREFVKVNNPQSSIIVCGWDTLTSTIIPFFRQFPLRAKKQRDFTIWSEAVEFAYNVSHRRPLSVGPSHNKKWFDDDFEVFAHYQQLLEQGRAYPS